MAESSSELEAKDDKKQGVYKQSVYFCVGTYRNYVDDLFVSNATKLKIKLNST